MQLVCGKLMNKVSQSVKEFPPENTIFVVNLWGTGDTDSTVKDLLENSLKIYFNDVLRTKRLESRTEKPGLIKVEFRTKNEKINALKAKATLKSTPRFNRVYIRSSMCARVCTYVCL